MECVSLNGCCGLAEVYELECLGLLDSYSKEEAKELPMMKENAVGEFAENCSATILTLANESGAREFSRQKKAVAEAGYKLLGWWWSKRGVYPGAKRHKIYLYGSKEFKMPARRGKK